MLVVEHLFCHTGRGRKQLLEDVSLHLCPGRMAAVLGPNGAGKSSLLKVLAGDLPVQQGSVRWNGSDLLRRSPQSLATQRAVLQQHNAVGLTFTVEEVVRMGRYPYYGHAPGTADHDAMERAMALTEVRHLRDRVVEATSGGEKQRTHIARVLAQVDHEGPGPRLLLLDEPLNDLDIKHQHTLLMAVRRFAEEGHCALVVLHDLNMAAQYAHHLLLMKDAQVVAQGGPDEVLTAPRLTEAFGMPAQVVRHPGRKGPLVFFGPPGEAFANNEDLPDEQASAWAGPLFGPHVNETGTVLQPS